MIRDALKSREWFDQWIEFLRSSIADSEAALARPSGNPGYRPQYVRDLAFMHLKLMLRCYSRGDPIRDLAKYFEPLISYWEMSEDLGSGVWSPDQKRIRHTWAINLDYYIDCFWLISLALTLNIPNEQWNRLIALIGNEGEDKLLDHIIATRQSGRRIGASLCYPKPYAKLLSVIDSDGAKQRKMLEAFVDTWYVEVGTAAMAGRQKQAVQHKEPYWQALHTMEGGYFGYWCLESVGAVRAFGLDDTLCVGHPHYPGDLLRPGLTTEPDALRLPKGLQASSTFPPPPAPGTPEHISGWEALKRVVVNRFKS